MEGPVSTSIGKSCSLAKADREDEKKMLPCRFFMSGYCHKGTRCRFYHPSQALANMAIKVPALPIHWTMRNNMNMVHPGIQPQMNHAYQPTMPKKSHFHLPHQRPMGNQQPYEEIMMSGYGFGQGNQNQPGPNNFHDYDLPNGNQATQRPSSGGRMNGSPAWTPPPIRTPMAHQSTLFNHIDWNEFLAPGQQPPPVFDVDRDKGGNSNGGGEPGAAAKPEEVQASNSNEDMPPEGTSKKIRGHVNEVEGDVEKKLSAKEEFQRKVKERALEEELGSGFSGDVDIHMASQ